MSGRQYITLRAEIFTGKNFHGINFRYFVYKSSKKSSAKLAKYWTTEKICSAKFDLSVKKADFIEPSINKTIE